MRDRAVAWGSDGQGCGLEGLDNARAEARIPANGLYLPAVAPAALDFWRSVFSPWGKGLTAIAP
jgi:hypothetical protein